MKLADKFSLFSIFEEFVTIDTVHSILLKYTAFLSTAYMLIAQHYSYGIYA